MNKSRKLGKRHFSLSHFVVIKIKNEVISQLFKLIEEFYVPIRGYIVV